VRQVRQRCCYFWFVGWANISVGITVCLKGPYLEIHVPFGFFRVGWNLTINRRPFNYDELESRLFGYAQNVYEPEFCIRASGHDGPCNGLPREDCLEKAF
jgi:hypothetical protein